MEGRERDEKWREGKGKGKGRKRKGDGKVTGGKFASS